jgi:gluconolactonase
MPTEAASPRFRDLIPEDAVLERISHGHVFTEGPVWNAREGALYFVDILEDTIWRWEPGVGDSVVLRPSGKANGMTYDGEGRLLVAGWTSRNIWRMAKDGSITTLATHYGGQKLGTPNDLVVKSDGAIYFTNAVGGLAIVGMEVDDIQQYQEGSTVMRLDPD